MSDQNNQNVELTPEMRELISELRRITDNPAVKAAYKAAIKHVTPKVYFNGKIQNNPWENKTIEGFVNYFEEWFTFLPIPNDGLGKIEPFTFFYLDNPKAFDFLNKFESRQNENEAVSKEIFNWTVKFIKARGKFMDSPESTKYLSAWTDNPSSNMQDFIVPVGGFKSFNEFFIRELKKSVNPRPIAEPNDDSVIVAPADSEINFLESDLSLRTLLKVKTRQINVDDLLAGSKYAEKFVGGTAVSCVLMPNSYHRYHSPVTGQIIESKEIQGIYNGITDGEDWFNHGNIGESTTDFSIFEDFHRAYFIFDTVNHGHVAMIPVGLNTISALFASMINNKSTMVPPGSSPVDVNKGDELGHFAYGGSLNILLFQKGVLDSVSIYMGQRIGTLNKFEIKT